MEVGSRKLGRKRKNTKLEICDDQVMAVDRLSDLPDALLISILSFLSIEKAVQTSTLSRRWKCLWMYHYNLNFGCRWKLIDKVLPLHKGIKVQNLYIHTEYKDSDSVRVDSWIHFAVARRVEKLDLVLYSNEEPQVLYKLPESIFLCESLVHLRLGCCKFNLPPTVHMAALKSFCLEDSEVSQNAILDFTSHCSLLEKLKLNGCNNRAILKVVLRNPNLVELDIVEYSYFDGVIAIDAPFVTSLSIDANTLRKRYFLGNLRSLKKAKLSLLELADRYCRVIEHETVLMILFGVRHAKQLQLCRGCLQTLSSYDIECGILAPFIKAQSLQVGTQLIKFEVLGLKYLLEWCSDVENLKIELDGGYIDMLCDELRLDGLMENEKAYSDNSAYYISCGNDWEKDFRRFHEYQAEDESFFEKSFDLQEIELWRSMGGVCATTLTGLKKVQIRGFLLRNLPKKMYKHGKKKAFRFRKRQTELVRILLQNLVGLNSITISTCSGRAISERSHLGKKMLTFPRASQNVQMMFL